MGVHTPRRGGFQVTTASGKGELNQPRALS